MKRFTYPGFIIALVFGVLFLIISSEKRIRVHMEIGNLCNTGVGAVCFNYLFCWQAKKYIWKYFSFKSTVQNSEWFESGK
jgi:hypothetical protein